MGSTMCKGGSLQYSLQLNQTTQTPKIRIIQITQCYKSLQDIQVKYKKIYKSHPRAKHAPSGTYSTWTAFTGI
jgi:hypothetical protein